ncbi:hypothetical protein EVAR_3825_1 [Eumeta japonica]|uniref:Uncharacterized protein n=1 Tax=Eumeta variegata TaxID=151549 RepID=A0A4C1SR83_EUMVA|nr:hypothetical protein EVAR_3825_1 [Eumeta japonica]
MSVLDIFSAFVTTASSSRRPATGTKRDRSKKIVRRPRAGAARLTDVRVSSIAQILIQTPSVPLRALHVSRFASSVYHVEAISTMLCSGRIPKFLQYRG